MLSEDVEVVLVEIDRDGLVPYFKLLREEILRRVESGQAVAADLETVIKKLEGE